MHRFSFASSSGITRQRRRYCCQYLANGKQNGSRHPIWQCGFSCRRRSLLNRHIWVRSELKSVAANHTAVCSWASSLFKNRCDQWLL